MEDHFFCPSCGSPLYKGDTFCQNCGRRVDNITSKPFPAPKPVQQSAPAQNVQTPVQNVQIPAQNSQAGPVLPVQTPEHYFQSNPFQPGQMPDSSAGPQLFQYDQVPDNTAQISPFLICVAGAAALTGLLDISGSFTSWITAAAAVLLLLICVKRTAPFSAAMAAVFSLFMFRFLWLDLSRLAASYDFSYGMFTILARLTGYTCVLLCWLVYARKIVLRSAAGLIFLGCSALQIIYACVHFFSLLSSGQHDWFYPCWICFALVYTVSAAKEWGGAAPNTGWAPGAAQFQNGAAPYGSQAPFQGGNAAPYGSQAPFQNGAAPRYGKVDAFAGKVVPQSLLQRFPGIAPTAFLAGFAGAAVLLIVVITIAAGGIHDLSGTWSMDGAFPITRINFSKDGTFTAYCDYYEYDTGDTYYGKYSKKGGTYVLKFTSGKSGSGGSVTQFTASSISRYFYLTAVKQSDGSLKVTFHNILSYDAWAGESRYFYPQ